jgi:hypothetical protein
MYDALVTHLLDVLAADSRLYAAGNAYAPNGLNANAWAGVKRPDNGTDSPAAGYINLFDSTAEPDAMDTRPAIYVGTRGVETVGRTEFFTMSAGPGRTNYEQLTIPLFIEAQAPTKHAARSQRNQLLGNVRRILLDHSAAESGFWWQLEMPGDVAGGARQIGQISGTGGTTGSAQANVVLPVVIHYSFNRNSLS